MLGFASRELVRSFRSALSLLVLVAGCVPTTVSVTVLGEPGSRDRSDELLATARSAAVTDPR
jgi:hypothetical protein